MEVPEWLQVPYVFSGYPCTRSIKSTSQCLSLLFRIHNQTVNAWSILAASAIAIGLYARVLTHNLKTTDNIVFASFLLSCIVHTPFAVGNHILRHMGASHYAYWKRMDVLFIFVASNFLTFSLSFYVFPLPITMLLTGINIKKTMDATDKLTHAYYGLGCNTNHGAHVRCLLDIVAIYMTPVIAGVFVNPSCFPCVLAIVVSLGLGAIVYLSGFPERFFPRKCDIYGASHQLMHVAIIAAYIAEHRFVCLMYENNMTYRSKHLAAIA